MKDSINTDYRARIVSADEAVKRVQSGHRVYIHNGCAEPTELVHALTRRGPCVEDVEVMHMATMGIADYNLPEYEGHFRTNSLFIGGNVRRAIQEGRGDYTPIFLSEIEGLFNEAARLERGGVTFTIAVFTDGDPSMDYGEQTIEGVAAALLAHTPG